MTYKEAAEILSEELGVPKNVVEIAYRSFFEFMRETIISLPLKEELTEEEFNRLRPNFNIPSLGKLHCTYDRYKGMKERLNYLNKLKDLYDSKED